MNDIFYLYIIVIIAISILKRIIDDRFKICKLYKIYCRFYGIKFIVDCVVGFLCLV